MKRSQRSISGWLIVVLTLAAVSPAMAQEFSAGKSTRWAVVDRVSSGYRAERLDLGAPLPRAGQSRPGFDHLVLQGGSPFAPALVIVGHERAKIAGLGIVLMVDLLDAAGVGVGLDERGHADIPLAELDPRFSGVTFLLQAVSPEFRAPDGLVSSNLLEIAMLD